MSDNKKKVANEIVIIFRQFKWSVIWSIVLGVFWFIGYSIYNDLVDYTFSKEKIWVGDAKEILGYLPEGYKHYMLFSELDELEQSNLKKEQSDLESSLGFSVLTFGKEVTKGFTNTDEENESVRKEIVSKLLDESIESLGYFMLLSICAIFIFYYLIRSFKWVKKHAD